LNFVPKVKYLALFVLSFPNNQGSWDMLLRINEPYMREKRYYQFTGRLYQRIASRIVIKVSSDVFLPKSE